MGGSWIVVVCFLGFWTCFWRYQFWGWFWEKFPAVTQLFLILRGESKSRYQGFNFKKKHYFFTYRNRISTDVSLPPLKDSQQRWRLWRLIHNNSPSFILGPEMNAWHSKKMIPKRPWRPWSDGRFAMRLVELWIAIAPGIFVMKKTALFPMSMAY